MALLTVVVPLYNQEAFIEKCISSIQKQSLQDIEIIIVDDGSTDDGALICEYMSKNDNRITVIHQENRGLSGARYTGIKNCKTKYITFVDADDFILEDSYSRALEYMERDIDTIFFEISRYFDENRIKRERHIFAEGFYDRERIEQVIYDKLIWDFDNGNPGMECSQCVRITKRQLLFDRYNKLTVHVYYGEDMAITYPLYRTIRNMQVVSYSYYMHRQPINEGCQSYIKTDGYFEEIFKLYNYLASQFEDCRKEHNIQRQIEYLYMYMVQLKKRKYMDEKQTLLYYFPFDKTFPHKRMLLYGAGNVGRSYYDQLKRISYCSELLWVDKDAEYIQDDRVKSIDEIWSYNPDFVIIAIKDETICNDVTEFLIKNGINKDIIVC